MCGYDLNLTYPQNGHFPTLDPPFPNFDGVSKSRASVYKKALIKQALVADTQKRSAGIFERAVDETRLAKRDAWKRDLAGRANGTIDPFYKCDLLDEMYDYAVNFSLPWSKCEVWRLRG